MFALISSLVRGKNRPQPQMLRPATSVRKYDGHWVIIVRPLDHATVIVRYEDDRTNSEYAVPLNKLK